MSTQLQIAPLVIAGNSIIIAGAALLLITAGKEGRTAFSIIRAWKYLIPASLLFAVGVFTWYDSVTRVGASKEGLLAGPLETIIILLLARAFLKERLSRIQTAGVTIALAGFFATVLSASMAEIVITWGDIEAVISAATFGAGIIFITKLTASHSALQVTGASLFISGLILAALLWTDPPVLTPLNWAFLLAFSVLPLSAAFTYVVGLSRIGASMTSTIGSFSILLTVLFQLVMFLFGIEVILPSHIPLAILGGALGVLGIYLIHRRERN
ncbi:MAG: DMT family transporter [Nitrososphaera sp.]|nr:DMT family transporter [Nitrososphaera sp.]